MKRKERAERAPLTKQRKLLAQRERAGHVSVERHRQKLAAFDAAPKPYGGWFPSQVAKERAALVDELAAAEARLARAQMDLALFDELRHAEAVT